MRTLVAGVTAACSLVLAPGLAAANTYDLDFTFGSETGDLVLTTSGPASPTGTLVTSISGEVNGFPASELAVDAFASNDNLLYSGSQPVDLSGIGFTFDGTVQSLYWTGGYAGIPAFVQKKYGLPKRDLNYDGSAFSYEVGKPGHKVTKYVLGDTGQVALCINESCSNSSGFLTGTFSITPGGVPEPATWAMMLVGIAGLGATMRVSRNKRQAALVDA